MREIDALRESQRKASTYRHDLRHHLQYISACIENGRAELQENYPNPLYEGESADSANKSAYPKTFQEPLTFELYEKHQQISEAAKP